MIISGDLTGDGLRGEYQLAAEYLDRIDCERLIVIPGNHDSRNVGYVHFEELFGDRRAVLHHDGVSIVAVDSTEPDLDHGVIGRGRYSWIVERFREHEAFLRIFVLHHHLLPVPGTGRERNVVHDAGDTLECLQRADVHLVLSGHKHVPYAWRLENLFVVNAGTVSTTRLRGKTKPCYNVIEAIRGARDRVPQVPLPRAGRDHLVRPAHVRVREGPVAARGDTARLSAGPVIALIDGEHHPAAVRELLDRLEAERGLAGVVFCGGEEKLGPGSLEEHYGRSVESDAGGGAATAGARRRQRSSTSRTSRCCPPRPSCGSRRSRSRSACATRRRARCSSRRATSPFAFDGPKLAVIGTGKRTGKTAVAGHWATLLRERGADPVIVCMGRGGPAEPCVREAATSLDELLAIAAAGGHAASDYLEDAVLAGVRTVGCRRVGGGLAGAPAESNVPAGAALAASLDPGALIFEGSGACIPPVEVDRTVCVVGPGPPEPFAEYRSLRADLVLARGGCAGACRAPSRFASSPSRSSRCPTGRAWRCSRPAGPPRPASSRSSCPATSPAAARSQTTSSAPRRALRRLPDRAQGGRDRHRRPRGRGRGRPGRLPSQPSGGRGRRAARPPARCRLRRSSSTRATACPTRRG